MSPLASHPILSELAKRLKNLDTIWPAATASENMAHNAATYLLILALHDQGVHFTPGLLADIKRRDSKDVFVSTRGPRVTIAWSEVLGTLRTCAPRSVPLVAHVRDTEGVEGVLLAEAVEWVVGLVRGQPNNEAPHLHAQAARAVSSASA